MSILSAILTLNWLAVLVAFLLHVGLSLVWFSPILFGKAWVKLSGKNMDPAKPWIPAGFLAHFVCVLALALVVKSVPAASPMDGLLAGVFVSLGFIGPILAGELVWEKIPFKMFLIRLGDQVLTLGLAGLILAAWR